MTVREFIGSILWRLAGTSSRTVSAGARVNAWVRRASVGPVRFFASAASLPDVIGGRMHGVSLNGSNSSIARVCEIA